MAGITIDRLIEATRTGEGLEVVYHGGAHPGCKRLLFPRRVAPPVVYALDERSGIHKSFRIDKLIESRADDCAEWAPLAPRYTLISDPEAFFSGWAYNIHRAHWPALGVTRREYIDKIPTARAREQARLQGLAESEVKRIAIKVLRYASSDNAPQFNEGDLFYPARHGLPALQVLRNGALLEVHAISLLPAPLPRIGYQISPDELAEWLQTGQPPEHGRITPAQSDVGVLSPYMQM